MISYLCAILINPGIPGREYYIEEFKKIANQKNKTEYQKCTKCNILVPKEFHVTHCSRCNVCVIEQDHHCPWTGKCIGKKNVVAFHFMLYLFGVFFVGLFVCFYFCIIYTAVKSKSKKGEKIKNNINYYYNIKYYFNKNFGI